MSVWQELTQALGEDFGDLPSLAQIVRVAVRLLVAALLGGLLGYQREHTGKAAGLRTHMLVCLGAALYVLLAQQAAMTPADISRVIQGIVTGIGFLGAGAILKRQDQAHIQGLTTAAGIWLTAAVGLAAGLGHEGLAILGTLLALLILVLIPHVSHADERR